ncbi:MAG: hypothetical protein GX810_05210 [Clostridiales bacterium]|nr:hypothetical protein [Clostridiales bacterium]
MITQIFASHDAMSAASARRIAEHIRKYPTGLICLAAGFTQVETLEKLVDIVRDERIAVEGLSLIGLDEWLGYGAGDQGSCYTFHHRYAIDPLGLTPQQVFLFDGRDKDTARAMKDADAYIDRHGGISLTVLGVGLNGHLGFNEPGCDPLSRSHVVELAQTSRDISGKYFGTRVPVTHGITLGMKDLFASRDVLVQCTGAHKADIMKKLHSMPAPDRSVPVSHIKALGHSCTLMMDRDSAAGITA